MCNIRSCMLSEFTTRFFLLLVNPFVSLFIPFTSPVHPLFIFLLLSMQNNKQTKSHFFCVMKVPSYVEFLQAFVEAYIIISPKLSVGEAKE